MGTLRKYLKESIQKMVRDRVKIVMGDIGQSLKIYRANRRNCRLSKRLRAFNCICLNYGGRMRSKGCKEVAADCLAGKIQPEEITDDYFEAKLYSACP